MQKNAETISKNYNMSEVAKNTGLVLMTLAATIGMIELTDHTNSKVVLNSQPVFAFATEHVNTEPQSSQRREREEAGPHFVSYSAAQRTPGRTGRV